MQHPSGCQGTFEHTAGCGPQQTRRPEAPGCSSRASWEQRKLQFALHVQGTFSMQEPTLLCAPDDKRATCHQGWSGGRAVPSQAPAQPREILRASWVRPGVKGQSLSECGQPTFNISLGHNQPRQLSNNQAQTEFLLAGEPGN